MLGSGKLNRRITLQRATVTRNARNEAVESWSDIATVWCERRELRGIERIRAQEVEAEITTRFVIRQSDTVATLNSRDRLIYAGAVYNIIAIRELKMNRLLEVDAVARDDIPAVEV